MRVLAVDDDAVARMALRGMVTALGHECVVAGNGEQAWQLLQAESFDVTITDRVMPDMDGLELCRRIRSADVAANYVYVVLASALGGEDEARVGMLAGADDYIAKPLRRRQLELKLIAAERVTAVHRQLRRVNDDLWRTVVRDAETNRRLTDVNKVQADMMAMIGHDARQPLSGAIGFIEATLEEWQTTSDEVRRANLVRAMSAARRVDQLIEDVLTMGNLDAGTIFAKPEPVLIRQILDDVIESAAAGVPVEVSGDNALRARVDRWHLRQIATNLIGNAVKYGTSPITVAVSASSVDGDAPMVQIIVCDSGEGVPEDFVPHLFERFTRAETGVATRKPGTGFGLYIVRSLAEANQGSIAYRPGTPNGACFVLTLPLG